MEKELKHRTDTILEAWEDLKKKEPKMRIRDAALALGVSEAELLATGCGGHVTRLDADWRDLFKHLPELGHIMALTRNDNVVHERKGEYQDVKVYDAMGLVLGEDIDLRVFFGHWRFGFAVEDAIDNGVRRSLQFFDRDGTAVHKIYLQEDGNLEAFQSIVEMWRAADQSAPLAIEPVAGDAADLPDEQIDFAALYTDWRDLQDTHDFFPMLKKYNVSRTQALRHADPDLARPVPAGALASVLEMVAEREIPIMVFVSSPGVIQIHTGPVKRIVVMGPWLNVLDPTFNLHLRQDQIASAWIVRKPTRDGTVTSLEVFDAKDRLIALFFGKRKPGEQEDEAWREVMRSVELSPAG